MKKTKRHLFGTTLLLATITPAAMASQADYQAEVGYELQQLDTANSINANETIHTLSFEYFLEAVKVDNQPLAEAAFMNRISSVVVGLSQSDFDADDRTGDVNTTIVQYTHMQQGSPLWLQVFYTQQSADFDFKDSSFIDFSYDRTITGFGAGSFISENTAVALEYTKDEVEFSPAVYSAAFDYTLTQIHVIAKHLMPIGNAKMVNIEGTIGTDSYDNTGSANTKNTVIEVKGEYYLNNMQSIGGTFEQITGDDNGYKGQAIAVHGKFFFTPKFFVAAKIRQFSGDGTSDDEDNITINANMRF